MDTNHVRDIIFIVSLLMAVVHAARSLRHARKENWGGAFYWLTWAVLLVTPWYLQ